MRQHQMPLGVEYEALGYDYAQGFYMRQHQMPLGVEYQLKRWASGRNSEMRQQQMPLGVEYTLINNFGEGDSDALAVDAVKR